MPTLAAIPSPEQQVATGLVTAAGQRPVHHHRDLCRRVPRRPPLGCPRWPEGHRRGHRGVQHRRSGLRDARPAEGPSAGSASRPTKGCRVVARRGAGSLHASPTTQMVRWGRALASDRRLRLRPCGAEARSGGGDRLERRGWRLVAGASAAVDGLQQHLRHLQHVDLLLSLAVAPAPRAARPRASPCRTGSRSR